MEQPISIINLWFLFYELSLNDFGTCAFDGALDGFQAAKWLFAILNELFLLLLNLSQLILQCLFLIVNFINWFSSVHLVILLLWFVLSASKFLFVIVQKNVFRAIIIRWWLWPFCFFHPVLILRHLPLLFLPGPSLRDNLSCYVILFSEVN